MSVPLLVSETIGTRSVFSPIGEVPFQRMSRPVRLVRNISYSVAANLISSLVGVAVILLVPKLIGVEAYGYFQLFLFFIGYVGFFHFGWADGIILRYAGEHWDQLNRARFSGQIILFLLFEISIWGAFCFASWLLCEEGDRLYVLLCTGICAVLVLTNTFLRFILQATNRIRAFAFLTLSERITYLLLVLFGLMTGSRSYHFYVASYIVAQVVSVVAAVYFCRDLLKERPERLKSVFRETRLCLSAGSKLMVANIASMLILGILRFGIERTWGVITFGKVSLLLSSFSFLFMFVSAVSTVLLPSLRGESDDYVKAVYFPLRCVLSWFLLAAFVFVWPAQELVKLWLPDYADALDFLPLLVPVCLYECTVNLATGTYLKVFRMEKDFLWGNSWALLVSVALMVTFMVIWKNLPLTLLSMTLALAVRLWLLEYRLTKRIEVSVKPILLTETLLCLSYVMICTGIGGWQGALGYVVIVVMAAVVSWQWYLRSVAGNIRRLIGARAQ